MKKLLSLLILILSSGCSSTDNSTPPADAGTPQADAAPATNTGTEYTASTPILDDAGKVVARGWARKPLFVFDSTKVPTDRQNRIREWDYYTVHAPNFAIALTFAKIPFEGLGVGINASVIIHDYQQNKAHTGSMVFFDTEKKYSINATPDGTYDIQYNGNRLSYSWENGRRIVEFSYGNAQTAPDEYLTGRIAIDAPQGDVLALVTPFKEEGHFFYEVKAPSMPATGYATYGTTRYDLPANQSFGVLDAVRGVMPKNMQWTWAVVMGTVDGQRVGVNLGTVFGDETNGTPNSIFVNDKLHKLGRVDEWTYNKEQQTQPWHIAAQDGRVDFTVSSPYFQNDITDMGFYKSTLWKPYGTVTGKVILDDGKSLSLDGLFGAAEFVDTPLW